METLVVWIILATVVAAAARCIYRALSGKDPSCGCGHTSCPFKPEPPEPSGETEDR